MAAAVLRGTNWFSGPSFLSKFKQESTMQANDFELVHPDLDQEIRLQVTILATKVTASLLGSLRFERFSTWKSVTRAVSKLIQRVRASSKTSVTRSNKESESAQAIIVIIKAVQQDVFPKEVQCLSKGDPIPKQSTL